MSRAGTIAWFAHHEGRLAWRDWLWLISGRRRSRRKATLGLIAIALFLRLAKISRATPPDQPPQKGSVS